MNWKNRFKRVLNKTTLVALAGLVVYLVFKVLHLFGFEPNADQYRDMYDILATFITILAVLGYIDNKSNDEEDNKPEQKG